MAQVQCEIDSIRVAVACPDELTLILKQKGSDSYVPVWLSQRQGEILADQLQGRPDREKGRHIFLADNNSADSDIECATLYLEGNAFLAKVLFSRRSGPCEVGCPIGLALAMAVMVNAPILVDEALFDRAGVRLT